MEAATPTAGAVKRALTILECLDNSRRGLNIAEMSRRLNIPRSSAHVIVLTLERLGYVEREPGGLHYSLGLKAYVLGRGMIKTLQLAETAQPHMEQLTQRLRLAAHLAVPDKEQGVFIQKVAAPSAVQVDTYVGRRMDLHCTGVGKVILAFGPSDIRDHALAKQAYMRHTENTITNPRLLMKELKRVLKAGYAVDDEEEELGVRCIAVPVQDVSGKFLAALSVTGPLRQMPQDSIEQIAEKLQETAAVIGSEKRGSEC